MRADGLIEKTIAREVSIARSPRVMQLEGLFDVPPNEKIKQTWNVKLPLHEKPWNIGLIVGPSGSGKSTVLKECFGENVIAPAWNAKASILDCFPKSMGIKDITTLLSSVGFSSPPSWMKPFGILSNGEQFRVTMARILAEGPKIAVVDEFTSVVDRVVAQVGSSAIAKTIRARNQKFVAAACHYDIIDWLQPDWTYEPALNKFNWRSLQRRPSLDLELRRVGKDLWPLFAPFHYLSAELSSCAQNFAAFYQGRPIVFCSLLSFPHPKAPAWRCHRIVTLPEYQGIGAGSKVLDLCASLMRGRGSRFRIRTSAPGFRASLRKSKAWIVTTEAGISSKVGPSAKVGWTDPRGSIEAVKMGETFEYVGPVMTREDANALWEKPIEISSPQIFRLPSRKSLLKRLSFS